MTGGRSGDHKQGRRKKSRYLLRPKGREVAVKELAAKRQTEKIVKR